MICTGTRTYRDRKHNFSNDSWWWSSWQGLKSCSCIYSEYIEWWKGSETRKCSIHTRVREFWNTHPPYTASPFGRINLEPHEPQHPSTGHPIPFGLGLGFGLGGRRQAPRPKFPYMNNQVDMWLHTRHQISKLNFWYHMVYLVYTYFGFGLVGLGIIFYFLDLGRWSNNILHTVYNSYLVQR